MADPIGPGNFRAYLSAFADGELNAEQSARVVRYMSDHPESCAELAALHRLRRTADRVVRADTPPVPEELQRRVADVVSTKAQAAPRPAAARWAAVAALVAVLTGALGYLVGRSTAPPDTTVHAPAGVVARVIPASLEST